MNKITTPEDADLEKILDLLVPPSVYHDDFRCATQIRCFKHSQRDKLLAWRDRAVEEARIEGVRKELDRLEGFMAIAQLTEDDLNTMLIWAKNARWALIAPNGQDTKGEVEDENT